MVLEQEPLPDLLIRYGKPSKLDQAPLGTKCKVIGEGPVQLYIQNAKNESEPDWVLLDDNFCENIYDGNLINK